MLLFENVTKIYNCHHVVNDINLRFEPARVYLLTGENGSGKSTILKLANRSIFPSNRGLIKNEFKKVSFLPEHFSLPNMIRVKSYLLTFCEKENNVGAVEALMNQVHLPNKYISSLSKGMHQKVGLIQTVLKEADLYLFDEPLDGLDSDAKEIFLSWLKELKDDHKTIVISTHYKEVYSLLVPIIIELHD